MSKRWRDSYCLESYNTCELEQFLQGELDEIAELDEIGLANSPLVWRHIERVALLENEIGQREQEQQYKVGGQN
jgi:hypothetical protein